MTEILPILALVAMIVTFVFTLWILHSAGQKTPELKTWSQAARNVYLIFIVVLLVPSVAMVMKGEVTWQQMVTGSMVAVIFALVSLLGIFGPTYQRILLKRNGPIDT